MKIAEQSHLETLVEMRAILVEREQQIRNSLMRLSVGGKQRETQRIISFKLGQQLAALDAAIAVMTPGTVVTELVMPDAN